MKKPGIYFTIVLLLIGCLFSFWVYTLYFSVVSNSDGLVYDLRPGTSKKTFVAELTEQRLITQPWVFNLYISFYRHAYLKAGEYHFPEGASLADIWSQVISGKGFVQHTFTLIPGWTFKQLRDQLNQTPTLKHRANTLSDKEIMEKIGAGDQFPEGNFFPETYNYAKGTTDLVILKQAFSLMQRKLAEAWRDRDPHVPYNQAYSALIAASLIEKEAYLDTERLIISGVIINRLNANMPLQIDPTVIYGLGDKYTGTLNKADLTSDTPYNTYVHKGLPPTPIAMPSSASIYAALHPQANDFYYYVVEKDHQHKFSRTLAEHQVAVSHYMQMQRELGIFSNGAQLKQHIHAIFTEAFKKVSVSSH